MKKIKAEAEHFSVEEWIGMLCEIADHVEERGESRGHFVAAVTSIYIVEMLERPDDSARAVLSEEGSRFKAVLEKWDHEQLMMMVDIANVVMAARHVGAIVNELLKSDLPDNVKAQVTEIIQNVDLDESWPS